MEDSSMGKIVTKGSQEATQPEIAVGTHFHVRHRTKTTLVFLPADGNACLRVSLRCLSQNQKVPE